MNRSEIVTRFLDNIEKRNWDAAFENFTDDCRFHAPGASFEASGREEAQRGWSAIVERADAHYRLVGEPVEHESLTVAFLAGEFTSEGKRSTFPGVVVARFEGDRIAEGWGLRG